MSLANDKKAMPRDIPSRSHASTSTSSSEEAFGERTIEMPAPVTGQVPIAPGSRRHIQRPPRASAPPDDDRSPTIPSPDDDDDQPTRMAQTTGPVPTVPSSTRGERPSGPGSKAGGAPPTTRPAPLPSLSSLLDEDGYATDSFSDDLAVSDGPPDPYVGTVLSDRYVLDRVLGEGGMGKVYRAHHKVIEKKVAVKVLHAELAKDTEAVGRFLREARAASSIGNPHIVDILDFGEAPDGATYFVMEYLNGQSLGDTLGELTRISPRNTVELSLQLCDGLAAAHAEGIVHRDLKPDNVILVKPKGTWAGQGHFVKILDFGIAKVTGKKGNTSKLTMAGAVFGTPHYMSPEQASGEAVDHRTDIYSLGVMMYEMLSGEVPFRAENFMGILTQHMYKAPPSLRERAGEGEACPAGLEAIVMKCMAKRPEARYQTMEELAADLLLFKETGEAKASIAPMSLPEPASSTATPAAPGSGQTGGQRRGLVVALAVAGLLLLGAAVAGVSLLRTPDPAPTVPTTAATATPGATAVRLYSDVPDAFALVDGRRTKLPDTVMVPAGKRLSVRVEAGNDHEPTTVDVDGSSPEVRVDLKRKASAASAPTASATSATSAASAAPSSSAKVAPGRLPGPLPGQPRPKGNPDGVVDPW